MNEAEYIMKNYGDWPVEGCIFDVMSSLNTKFFQIWSSVTGYGELCVCF